MLFKSDRKYDKNQVTTITQKGEQLSSVMLMKLRDMILSLVQPGRGIQVERRGERVFIHATGGGGGRGMATGGTQIWYTASSKAALPNTGLLSTALGRVISGANNGVIYVRNPDNDGWDAINRLE